MTKSDIGSSHLDLSELAAIAGQADRAHPHLQTCELCREIVALIEGIRNTGTPPEGSHSPEPRCIEEREVGKLFEEEMEAGPALALLQHAAGCNPCGRRLKELAFVFSPAEDASVDEIVDQLRSSSVEWQRATVKRLATADQSSQPSGRPVNRYQVGWHWWAAAAAAVVLVATAVSWNRLMGLRAEQLLAQAYTEGRPFDFRLPDKGHTAITQQMGAAVLPNRSLMKATDNIYSLSDSDPRTKLLKGRAELIGRDADAAVGQLQNLELPGDEAYLDLAVALGLRGDLEGRTEDFGQALDYVSRYLKTHPDSREGLFNKALLLERLQLVEDAITAWDRYLAVDGTGPWADEVIQHKAALQRRKTAWERRREVLSRETLELMADAESYLSRKQFAKVYRQPRDVQVALGEVLVQQHQDEFLRDYFGRWNPANEAAFEHVLKAFDAMDRENYQAALPELREAETGFAGAGNMAGKYRASADLSYALQRSVQPKECVAAAQELRDELSPRHKYPWLEIQAEVQIASCAEMGGNTSQALDHAEVARELAETHKYLDAGLRATSVSAEAMTRLGDRRVAWAQGVRDLGSYWDASNDLTRAYQILINEFWAAEKRGWTHAQVLLGTAACREIGRNGGFPVAELSCRIELAGAARRIKDEALAREQVQAAGKLIDSVQAQVTGPKSPAQIALIRYASALVDGGDLAGATDQLQRLESASDSGAYTTRLPYLTAVGRLHLADHQTGLAEKAFGEAQRAIMEHLAGLANELDQSEATEAASLYRLSMEAHVPGTPPREDLEAWESFRARIRAPKFGLEPVAKTAPKLTEETALILIRLRGGIEAWTVDSRGVSSKWTPIDDDELDQSIRHMTELCADPRSRVSEIDREGRRLYQWLIAPVADRLAERGLIAIEPDESLSSIPFRALVTGSGEYWGQRVALEEIDSLADYLHRRSEPQPQHGGQTLLVSNPSIKGKLARIYQPLNSAGDPVSESDRRTIVKFAGEGATFDNIDKARAEANVFHFFGHATSTVESSALLLAAKTSDAEMLNADRVRAQDWSKTRLVVLSACSTAVGETFGPTNRDGLVRGFLEAGAARVIASQWDVDASATAQLFRKFYDYMARGGDTARALQGAEMEIALAKDTAHPYYWAAFNLYGTH